MSQGNGKPTTEIYAIVAVHGPDDEAVMGANMGAGWMPFLFSQERMVTKTLPLAQRIAEAQGLGIKVVKFTQREEIELSRFTRH